MAASDETPSGLALIVRPQRAEAALWRKLRFEADAGAREKLFDQHRPMARAVAAREYRRRPPYGLERGDFEQLAYAGLLQAIDRFDPLRGVPFEPFARLRIRGSIADGIARSSESGAQYSHRRRLEIERLRSLEQSIPKDDADLFSQLSELGVTLALGLLVEHAKSAGGAFATQPAQTDPYDSRVWRELQASVMKEVERLGSAERTVLEQHYRHGVAFTQIATLLGVSKGRVSQIHKAALLRVRERLRRLE